MNHNVISFLETTSTESQARPLLSLRSSTGCVCKEETSVCLTWTHFQPVILRLAPAITFTQMHAGKEVHCWVKHCYCWLDEDKEQLIKIVEKQYNSLLRCLPEKTSLSCQFTDQDTQTEGDGMSEVLLIFKWAICLTAAMAASIKSPPVQICIHKNPHRKKCQIKSS